MGVPTTMLPHTVARVRPSSNTDSYGNATLDFTVPPATSVSFAAWLQQDDREEPLSEGRDPFTQRWLMVSNETDVAGGDRIVWGSITFEVDGPPEPTYTPASTTPHHLEATLRRVEG